MSPNEATRILLDPNSTPEQIKEVEKWVDGQEVLMEKAFGSKFDKKGD